MYTSLVMLVVLSSFLGCGSTTQISITPDTVSVRSLDLPSIQCTPGSLSSKTVLHMLIKKVGETEPLATVSQQNHNTTQTTPAVQVQADGLIQEGGSFLNVTFENIIPNMSGEYLCEITFFDEDGNVEKSSDTASLTVTWIDTLQDSMNEIIVQCKHQQATLDNQQNIINILRQNLANQTKSLARSLEKNQQDLIDRMNSIAQSLTNRVTSLEAHHLVCPDSSWTQVDKLCYKAFHTPELYWPDALNYCRTSKGTLVQIHNQETNAMVAGLITGHPNKVYWIGANDIKDEGQFEWVASSTRQTAVPITKTSYQNWYSGEPSDDGSGGEDCVAMSTWSGVNGKWWDGGCNDYKYPFVCQTNAIYLQH